MGAEASGVEPTEQNGRRGQEAALTAQALESLLIAVQSLVNVGVVSGWIPPTGVTAPFLSYGGSSVISLLFLVGLVLNVSRRNTAAFWEEVGNQRCLPVSMERNRQERQSTRR